MTELGIDFETWAPVSIQDVGTDAYVNHPEFKPLRAAVETSTQLMHYDFLLDPDALSRLIADLQKLRDGFSWFAHHAHFERLVMNKLGIPYFERTICTAALSRVYGLSGDLGSAGAQLFDISKDQAGPALIKKFSLAQECPTAESVSGDPDWRTFGVYCGTDASIARKLGDELLTQLGGNSVARMHREELTTSSMNTVGWPVDTDLVKAMNQRYHLNLKSLEQEFRDTHLDAKDLNLNSLKQLKEWCATKGINATSFSKEAVESMLQRIAKRLSTLNKSPMSATTLSKIEGLRDVSDLLILKQALGGSALKKLEVILEKTDEDNRLRGSYLHNGAGQTARTSGVGVQMQNLKQMEEHPPEINADLVMDPSWDNNQLAANIRQVFQAHNKGQIIVGDFSSIESRALAHLAGETWKTDAYFQGKDIYKETAARFFGTQYDDVTKPERQAGKVGELSCGYGAGPGAVQSFASKMGIDFDEGMAGKIVRDWRAANPKIVELWRLLDEALTKCVRTGTESRFRLPNGFSVTFLRNVTPASLLRLMPGARSVRMVVFKRGRIVVQRFFHGCYLKGDRVQFFKPSKLKTGDVWTATYMDQKTKRRKPYSLYGGKLAGLLTQSLCREIFFNSLVALNENLRQPYFSNVKIIGQFHDEIALEWQVKSYRSTLADAKDELKRYMTSLPSWLDNFPLDAVVQSAPRYIK